MGIDLLDAALGYALKRGWYVFPLAPGGKQPLGALVPQGKDNATRDEATIRGWWQAAPEANIGIALAPSGLLALDVDVSGDKQGKESLRSIIAELPPRTLTQRTARGGVHALYIAPPGVAPTNRLGFKPGLDLIGVGYIVAAPSTFEGSPYAWINDEEITPCPKYLAQLVQERPVRAITPTGTPGVKVVEGGRNASLFRLGAALRDTGLGEQAVTLALLSTNTEQCVPPLPDDEVVRIASSACRTVSPTRNVLLGEVFANSFSPPLQRPGDPPPPSQKPQDAPGALFDLSDVSQAPPDPRRPPRLSEIASRETPAIRKYPTLFPTLDVLMGGGWISRTLHVLLGPPGAGKTAFMAGIALHHTRDKQRAVVYACTELESEEITYRCAAPLLGVPWGHLEEKSAVIDGARVTGAALQAEVRRVLAEYRIHVWGSESLARGDDVVRQLALSVQCLTEDYGEPPLVIVDYMQDLARGTDANNVRGKIGDLATTFRALAQAADCPMVMVSSVSRNYYGQAKAETLRNANDASVYLAAAKESGDVDYAAATVLFLDTAEPDGDKSRPARIAVAKARRGHTGFAGARFAGATGDWSDDPEAVDLMSPEALRAKKVDTKTSAVDDKVLAYMRTAGVAMSKRTAASGAGIKGANGDAAVERLLEAKLVSQVGLKFIARPTRKE